MRIISVKKLKDFWGRPNYRDSEQALRAWYTEVKKANWTNSHQVKRLYKSASFVGGNRVVFNVCGNKYRLIVAMKYEFKICYIRFIGTHQQYDKIDAKEV